MKPTKKVIGYVRVSTLRQAEKGVSLEAQRDSIRRWAKHNNAHLLEIYSDNGKSGTNSNRPGFQEAIKIAIKNNAALVVYNLSRFSRSLKDAVMYSERLRTNGADLVSIKDNINTTTATGKFQFAVLSAMNALQSDLISEVTIMALDFRKSQGKKLGGDAPFGYDADSEGMLSKNPIEQKVIKIIDKQLASGMNYSQIALHLNKNKHKTKRGSTWYPQTVKNVIKAIMNDNTK